MAYYILKSYRLTFSSWQIFQALRNSKNCFFLDSSLKSKTLGRYSFLGCDPFAFLRLKAKEQFSQLRNMLAEYSTLDLPGAPPFLGGAVGYFAYPGKNTVSPDAVFGFYNSVIAIDHLKGRLYILACGIPEKKGYLAKSLARANFAKILQLVSRAASFQDVSKKKTQPALMTELRSSLRKAEYLAAVKKAKEHIRQGDIYQVNLSQEFRAKTNRTSFEVYQRLRSLSPSCFGAYFDATDQQILSSSPERFLCLQGRNAFSRPMKGTRGRSSDKKRDARLKNQLLKSSKDKAELVMIVDLLRNDFGRVCNYRSIKVKRLRQIEAYNTVYQTTASVTGKLYKNKDAIDLFTACFPGGSITGCPKIRAMQIIEELEPHRRGIYTGNLGYFSFSGNVDFNILIRTVLKNGNQVYFGAGGGIVADSDPEAEYEESLVKAKAMIEAL